MKEIPTASPLLNAPPTQDFSKLGFVYITVLGLANQVVPHTGSWRPLATALNYLIQITPIVYMALDAGYYQTLCNLVYLGTRTVVWFVPSSLSQ
ncbi:hypothetical protein DSO57_1033375 [Entomophthora muscae]|uniref:Uncharacterized protein n=1 Tax=Entomophthora muscae TaxID=34485 RepID=A0ACC2TAW7_9FUNG|nr:hypothetical protein DSO57_1033375 [Entomophthora muscae]